MEAVFGIEEYKAEEDYYEFDPDWGRFDFLVEVARVCHEKLMMMKENFNNIPPRTYEKKSQGSVDLEYFKNNVLKLKDLVEEKAMGFKNDDKMIIRFNKNSSLKRKLESKDDQEELMGFKNYFHEKRLNKNPGRLKGKLEGKDQEEVGLKSKKRELNIVELPENVKQHIVGKMGGSDWLLVIQKSIYYSDINPSASRFSIPFSQIQTQFLYDEEAEDLDEKMAMEVQFLDPSLKETTLTFKKWSMGKSSTYNLTKKWNEIVKNNELEIEDVVQLWSFRVESKLCFALVKVNNGQQGSEASGECSHSKGNEEGASSSQDQEDH